VVREVGRSLPVAVCRPGLSQACRLLPSRATHCRQPGLPAPRRSSECPRARQLLLRCRSPGVSPALSLMGQRYSLRAWQIPYQYPAVDPRCRSLLRVAVGGPRQDRVRAGGPEAERSNGFAVPSHRAVPASPAATLQPVGAIPPRRCYRASVRCAPDAPTGRPYSRGHLPAPGPMQSLREKPRPPPGAIYRGAVGVPTSNALPYLAGGVNDLDAPILTPRGLVMAKRHRVFLTVADGFHLTLGCTLQADQT